MFVTNKKTATWCDGVATTWEVKRSKGARFTSERVVLHRWHDSGDVIVRHCKGDGRTASFRVFLELNYGANVSDDEATAVAVRLLGGAS